MKIAILTDLHAFSSLKEGAQSPSWLSLREDQSNARVNPFAGLRKLISDEDITADAVLCCGDMGDKGEPDAQQYAWKEVVGLKAKLKADIVMGTAGNHDLDSRFQFTKYDAKGQIQALDPPFPTDKPTQWLEYWAKNFTHFDTHGARFVLLNSAAYHGYGGDQKAEFSHGRVSDRTIDRMIADLTKDGERSANILVCHHHPFKNDEIKIEDYSEMAGGERLLNQLTAANLGPWLVIHGHKHMPRIFYAPGGNGAPTIFSAGSFSARLFQESLGSARNEFYILDIQVPQETGLVTSLRGSLTTWQWSYGVGWVVPKAGEGLGPRAAFGARAELGLLANKVASELSSAYAGEAVAWGAVESIDPAIPFLIPADRNAFLSLLQSKYGIKAVAHYATGELTEVQVPNATA